MSKQSDINDVAKPQGRIQRTVLEALQKNATLTTSQLAQLAYGRSGECENHDIIRAIRGLTNRGYSFSKVRRGVINKSGFVYVWSLQ